MDDKTLNLLECLTHRYKVEPNPRASKSKIVSGIAAATLTGLFSPAQADADIIFIEGPGQLQFNPSTFYDAQFQSAEIRIGAGTSYRYGRFQNLISVSGDAYTYSLRAAKSGPYGTSVRRFSAGQSIGPSIIFSQSNLANGMIATYNVFSYRSNVDPWGAMAAASSGPVNGFMGIRFGAPDDWMYGWLELDIKYTDDQRIESLALLGWAYEDSGANILAGDTGQIPEPSSAALAGIAMLAMGATGIRRRRRERNAPTKP